MSQEFQCYRCDGQSVILPDDLEDGAHITCRNCGALHGTLGQFREMLIGNQASYVRRPVYTGC